MIVLGLTGSIGMGKSFVASIFAERGVPVFDADKEVHAMLAPEGAAEREVSALFPEALGENGIDRAALGKLVFKQRDKLLLLEGILHPKVRQAAESFIKEESGKKSKLAVLDIPLLFEVGMDALCDKVLVVFAPEDIQAERLKMREGISKEQLEVIKTKQLSSEEKIKLADYVLNTHHPKEMLQNEIAKIMAVMG